jgi:hypothetical protein
MLVSGLLGDVEAPVVAEIGCYLAAWAAGQSGTIYLGRRATSSAGMLMIGNTLPGATPTLDSGSYGGYNTLQNPGPFSFSAQVETGVFHLLARVKTANATYASVYLQPDIVELNPADIGRARGPQIYPFAAQNTWTLADIGQVILPPFPLSTLTDPTKISGFASSVSGGPGAGSQLTANLITLVPVDGKIGVFQLSNGSNDNSITAQWFYVYSDSLSLGTSYSVESVAIPNPAHGGSMAANLSYASGTEYGVSNIADSILTVDPNLSTLVGSTTNRGVNQFAIIAADNAATLWPVAVELVYSPLYLYPL